MGRKHNKNHAEADPRTRMAAEPDASGGKIYDRILATVATLGLIFGGGWTLYKYREDKALEYRMELMKQKKELYQPLCAAAGKITAAKSLTEARPHIDVFWSIYFGDVHMVEDSGVQKAKEKFGEAVRAWTSREDEEPPAGLIPLALDLVAAAQKSVALTKVFGIPPEKEEKDESGPEKGHRPSQRLEQLSPALASEETMDPQLSALNPWALGIVTGLISGLITGTLTCWFFYWLGGLELRKEAADLRRLNILLIRALHNAGVIHVARWDEDGNPQGLRIELSSTVDASVTGRATAGVQHNVVASGGPTLEGAAKDELRKEARPPEGK